VSVDALVPQFGVFREHHGCIVLFEFKEAV
jgi:hypothetical protein